MARGRGVKTPDPDVLWKTVRFCVCSSTSHKRLQTGSPRTVRTLPVQRTSLATSGLFAEAILGRSNASEKIDLTRTQLGGFADPNAAPAIQPVSTDRPAQSLPPLVPTVTVSILDIALYTATGPGRSCRGASRSPERQYLPRHVAGGGARRHTEHAGRCLRTHRDLCRPVERRCPRNSTAIGDATCQYRGAGVDASPAERSTR